MYKWNRVNLNIKQQNEAKMRNYIMAGLWLSPRLESGFAEKP